MGDWAATDARLDPPLVERSVAAQPSPRTGPPPLTSLWTRHPRAWVAIRGFREVLLIGAVYSMYDLTRFLVAGNHAAAFSHARSIINLELTLHLDPEHELNRVFSAHLLLGLPSDYIYASLHYLVTPVVLIWLWRRHGPAYSRARNTLMLATILGLIGFSLLPVAPPRMVPSFIDTMTKFDHYGWWSTDASAPRGFGADTNEFAALPSLHVGWALWCGWQLVRFGRHRVTQVLGVAYPLLISVVVLATANHYLIDVVAGVVVLGIAALLVRLGASLAWRLWPRISSFSPLSSSHRAPA